MLGRIFLGLTSTKQRKKCLAQGHNAVPPLSLKPTTPQSQVKHSTTEPPRSSVCVHNLIMLSHSHNVTFGNIKLHLPIGLPKGKTVKIFLQNKSLTKNECFYTGHNRLRTGKPKT